jgi:hypothetical protein
MYPLHWTIFCTQHVAQHRVVVWCREQVLQVLCVTLALLILVVVSRLLYDYWHYRSRGKTDPRRFQDRSVWIQGGFRIGVCGSKEVSG